MVRAFRYWFAFALFILPLSLQAQLYSGPESIAFDIDGNRYIVSNYYTGTLVALDTSGTGTPFVTGLQHCYGNCIVGDTLWITGGADSDLLRGIDLTTGFVVFEMQIPPLNNLDGLAADSVGHIYVVDTGGRIYKVYPDLLEYTIFVNTGLGPATQDIIYDHENNRLLAAGYSGNAPIVAIDLADSTTFDVITTPMGFFDGISLGPYGNIYLASHSSGGTIWRYDNDFEADPVMLSQGHSQPAGLDYNWRDHIIAVPNFTGNSVDLIPVQSMHISVDGITLTDDGNNDGRPDPGETCQVVIGIKNHERGPQTSNVVGFLSTTDSAIQFSSASANYGDISPGTTVTNDGDPFVFTLDQTDPHIAEFMLVVTYDQTYREFFFDLTLGRPPILLVDDDGNDNHEQYYLASFDSLDIFVDVWEEVETTISGTELNRYNIVVWETGDQRETLDGTERDAVSDYLDAGGRFLFSSTNAGADLGQLSFYNNYLRAEFVSDTVPLVTKAFGVDGCPFSNATDSILFIGGGGAASYQSLDAITPVGASAEAFLYEGTDPQTAGIFYDGSYKLIYLAFPLESVSGLISTLPREVVLDAMLLWLENAAVDPVCHTGQPAKLSLSYSYPNPFNSSTVLLLSLPANREVSLDLVNLAGQRIKRLYQGRLSPGKYTFTVDGAHLSSGIYYAVLQTGIDQIVRQLILLK